MRRFPCRHRPPRRVSSRLGDGGVCEQRRTVNAARTRQPRRGAVVRVAHLCGSRRRGAWLNDFRSSPIRVRRGLGVALIPSNRRPASRRWAVVARARGASFGAHIFAAVRRGSSQSPESPRCSSALCEVGAGVLAPGRQRYAPPPRDAFIGRARSPARSGRSERSRWTQPSARSLRGLTASGATRVRRVERVSKLQRCRADERKGPDGYEPASKGRAQGRERA